MNRVAEFSEMRKELKRRGVVGELYHVGSSRFDDVYGKNDLDILLMCDLREMHTNKNVLLGLGFSQFDVKIPNQYAVMKFKLNPVDILIADKRDEIVRERYIDFIEILANHPELREKYSERKKAEGSFWHNYGKNYKDEFVTYVLTKYNGMKKYRCEHRNAVTTSASGRNTSHCHLEKYCPDCGSDLVYNYSDTSWDYGS